MTFQDAVGLWLKSGVIQRVRTDRHIRIGDILGLVALAFAVGVSVGYFMGFKP